LRAGFREAKSFSVAIKEDNFSVKGAMGFLVSAWFIQEIVAIEDLAANLSPVNRPGDTCNFKDPGNQPDAG
jgi:hypothetical protein